MNIDLSHESGLCHKKVLVTGGTGFIGGRLIERLVSLEQVRVRALVHDYARASRIARLRVEMVSGNVLDPRSLEAAAQGCDVIFHCALSSKGHPSLMRDSIVRGTSNVMRVAAESGVKRVVYVSTVSVYGHVPAGTIDERCSRRRSGDTYSDAKLTAESIVFRHVREGLPVTIIQPTIVYGPWGTAWTTRLLSTLNTHRVILVDGGDGVCNAVYVDDVVTALLLAATRPSAIGEAFLISGEEPTTWASFYGAYQAMLDRPCLASMSRQEALALLSAHRKARSILRQTPRALLSDPDIRAQLRDSRVVGLLKGALPTGTWDRWKNRIDAQRQHDNHSTDALHSTEALSVQPLSEREISFFTQRSRVSIEKARRVLGFRPAFDLDRGMWLTERWAKWAGFVGWK